MQVSFCFHPLRCSEILVSPSICTKIRTWRFHRTEEVSNNFSVSRHITHISMAISANLGWDTDHNSTKLVCAHPLAQTKFCTNLVYVLNIETWRKVISRSVHDFGTCKENAAAQCRLPTNSAAKHVLKSEVGTVQPHPPCKYQSHWHAQT